LIRTIAEEWAHLFHFAPVSIVIGQEAEISKFELKSGDLSGADRFGELVIRNASLLPQVDVG
jgi:hypothetical protein